ncbi:MAG: hypothetical protein KDA60_10575 [Planctomycetales bacterium]|nr:hypothetical protein [Planctomycetales bacterium]
MSCRRFLLLGVVVALAGCQHGANYSPQGHYGESYYPGAAPGGCPDGSCYGQTSPMVPQNQQAAAQQYAVSQYAQPQYSQQYSPQQQPYAAQFSRNASSHFVAQYPTPNYPASQQMMAQADQQFAQSNAIDPFAGRGFAGQAFAAQASPNWGATTPTTPTTSPQGIWSTTPTRVAQAPTATGWNPQPAYQAGYPSPSIPAYQPYAGQQR